jgi:hypothetical protein
MKWEREAWRKLYVRTSAEWRAMPLSARGLGDELLKYADDDGVIVLLNEGEHPGDAISRTVGAHPSEFERVRADCDALLAGGRDAYLVVRGRKLVIRNYYEAQNRVTPSAVRMQRKRQKEQATTRHSDAARDANSDAVNVTGSDAGVTEKRNEEKRNEEKKNPLTPASGGGAVDPPDDPKPDPSVTEIFDHWRETLDHPRAVLDSKRRGLITRAIKAHGVDKVRDAITGCRASPHHMGKNKDGAVYDGLDLILRSADHIERFAARADDPPIHRASPNNSQQHIPPALRDFEDSP